MNKENIQDFYPLSPMQLGMLYHGMYSETSTAYVEQLDCVLEGELNQTAFRRSWEMLLDRHTILRTAFIVKRLKEPVQIVLKKADLPLEIMEADTMPETQVANRIEKIRQSERLQGFDFTAAPLFRLKLIRLDACRHQLIWTYHHILLDGWSMPILLQEFLLLYETSRAGRSLSLPPARPYRDYIAWIKKQDMSAAEQFWTRVMGDFESPTPLPADLARGGEDVPTDYGIHEIKLPEDVTRRIVEFSSKNQVTVNTLIQGAWALLLGRYANTEDVVFGATVAGRPADLPGAEKMLGLFINTLPVRVCLKASMVVSEYLKEIQAYALDTRQYEFTPLIDIQGWSGVPRDIPLFNSIVVYENYPARAVSDELPGRLRISDIDLSEETNFPLTVVAGMQNCLMLRFIYDKKSFSEKSIDSLLRQYQTVIEKFVQQPDTRLSRINLLTASEQDTILTRWNATEEKFKGEAAIHRIFEKVAEKQPDTTGIVFAEQSLSYRKLNEQANQLAHYIRRKGGRTEDRIGIYLPRSVNAIISILAVLKSGGAYLPLDPEYPADRIKFMVQDADVKLILSEKSLAGELDFFKGEVICLDKGADLIGKQLRENHPTPVSPENLAYIIYTSGSTGRPKGTLVSHRGVINLATAMRKHQQINPGDKILQFFSLSFDGSVADIFGALLNGATLLLASHSSMGTAGNLARSPFEIDATHFLMPPSLLTVLQKEAFYNLKTVVSGGEECPPEVAEKWSAGVRFMNAYGPTEGTVASTWHIYENRLDDESKIPIGRPLQNIRAFLLDRYLNPVPPGMGSEIFVGGVNLARGYLNRPELTAEKFIPNPYALQPGERLYRTGDKGKFRADGNIVYLGRIDRQVKIRGFRIEIGEIESVLNQHPQIIRTAVLDHGRNSFDKYLVAYVLPAEKNSGLKKQLQSFCAQKLPEYMIPAKFVILEEFPLTTNGKVDTKALRSHYHFKSAAKVKTYIPPRDDTELQLTQIWEEILEKKRIGVTDNFFELGGHSLLAIRLVGQIEDRFGKEIPLVQVLKEPTIEHLAALLREGDHSREEESLLIEMKKGNGKQPLYFVHPSGGSVHWYADLARNLEPERPFIGIQAVGIDKKQPLDQTIPAMAGRYARLLQNRQNGAPFYIGGWSLGVVVAYELARQLTNAGAKVETLFILDQGPALPFGENPENDLEMFANMFSGNFKLEIGKMKDLSPEEQLKIVFKKAKRAHLIPFYVRFSDFKFYMEIQKTMRKAWFEYKPEPYPGDIVVIRSEEMGKDTTLPKDLGWAKLALGRVEIVDVPGDHLTMMREPHVLRLSKTIDDILKMKA